MQRNLEQKNREKPLVKALKTTGDYLANTAKYVRYQEEKK